MLLTKSFIALAQWKIETKIDSMTDEKKHTATITNEQGNSLSIYRIGTKENSPVWANFSIASDTFNTIQRAKDLAMYRIDKNPPEIIDITNPLKNIGIITATAEPKWVNFLIWHGKEKEGRNKTINNLIQGESIVFRYQLFTGGYKETKFKLSSAGSGKAISQALGISERVDPIKEAELLEYSREFINQIDLCFENRHTQPYTTCSEKVRACSNSAENNKSSLISCLQ